jgi:hypothetical protein
MVEDGAESVEGHENGQDLRSGALQTPEMKPAQDGFKNDKIWETR